MWGCVRGHVHVCVHVQYMHRHADAMSAKRGSLEWNFQATESIPIWVLGTEVGSLCAPDL